MIRLIIGLIFGIVVSRNAGPMKLPSFSAVIGAAIVGWGLCYYFGRRDKNSATATAVAVAVANANSVAEAKAQAYANAAVQVVLQSTNGNYGEIESIRSRQIDTGEDRSEISQRRESHAVDHSTTRPELPFVVPQ